MKEFPIIPIYGLNIVAAILKFKMAAHTEIPNVIFTCCIGFLDAENMGSGHFEMYFLNDEARVGNSESFDDLFSMII